MNSGHCFWRLVYFSSLYISSYFAIKSVHICINMYIFTTQNGMWIGWKCLEVYFCLPTLYIFNDRWRQLEMFVKKSGCSRWNAGQNTRRVEKTGNHLGHKETCYRVCSFFIHYKSIMSKMLPRYVTWPLISANCVFTSSMNGILLWNEVQEEGDRSTSRFIQFAHDFTYLIWMNEGMKSYGI